MDFTEKMDLVNGIYRVTLVSLDNRTLEKVEWELGEVKVWFKDGMRYANNQGMSQDYFPGKEIVSQFPVENRDNKSPIVSLYKP